MKRLLNTLYVTSGNKYLSLDGENVVVLEEQQEIVAWLDKYLPKYDSLIAEKESLINDLEAYKKSLIYEVVTGKRRVV